MTGSVSTRKKVLELARSFRARGTGTGPVPTSSAGSSVMFSAERKGTVRRINALGKGGSVMR